MTEIPSEAYAALGALVVSNLGLVIGGIKSLMKKEVDFALMNQRIDFVLASLGEIKAKQDKFSGDLDAAHDLIRDLKK